MGLPLGCNATVSIVEAVSGLWPIGHGICRMDERSAATLGQNNGFRKTRLHS
ncbi:hypothetical protein [Sphingomonas cynarae]|uniref:hypothetical protein n=1 Tax=Sphingomonas cynarae TaxID=930197 RepID=UPI0031DD5079